MICVFGGIELFAITVTDLKLFIKIVDAIGAGNQNNNYYKHEVT